MARRMLVVVMLKSGANVGLVYGEPEQARDLQSACLGAVLTGLGPDGSKSLVPPEDSDGAAVVLDAGSIVACMVAPEPSRSIAQPIGRMAPVGRG